MAEEEVMESIAEEPVESIADAEPADGAETAPKEAPETPAEGAETAPEGQQDAEKPAEPEDYRLEAGEDFNVPQENLQSFEKACKDAKLSKAQAEALLGWHKSFAGDVAKYQQQQEAETVKAWQTEILKDPEFGGQSWKATVADSRRALAEFDTDGRLRAFLKAAHADYHPDVVRCIARVGRAMREDKIVTSKGNGNSVKALEDRMWPDMTV